MINSCERVRNYCMLKYYFVYFSGSASVCGKYLHIQFYNLKERKMFHCKLFFFLTLSTFI